MIKTARQLKDLIRNLSKKDAADAQVLMRNYMMERFLDRMIRNDETHRELIGIVEYFWSEIQNDNNACIEDVRTKLEKITE